LSGVAAPAHNGLKNKPEGALGSRAGSEKVDGLFRYGLLQQVDLARFLIDRMVPCDRKTRQGVMPKSAKRFSLTWTFGSDDIML